MGERDGEVLRVEAVEHGFGRRRVLGGVSLAVGRGEVVALLGRNGEGKTTLVRLLLGHMRPRSGEVRVFGLDPWRARARLMERVGVVPEAPDAPPGCTVAEVLAYCAALHPRWNAGVVAERLGKLDIPARARVGRLSRGQRAQLQLALALGGEPDLLVLDDPTLGLDAVARRELYGGVIGDLAGRGTTVFLTSHDLDGVERLAERVAFLHRGRIVAQGRVEELRRSWSERLGRAVTLEEIFVEIAGKGGAA